MAKETRKITQYKISSIVVEVEDNSGTAHYISIGIFDDTDVLEPFVEGLKKVVEPRNIRIIEDWTETKPAPDNFNIPLNMDFDADHVKKILGLIKPKMKKAKLPTNAKKNLSKNDPLPEVPDELIGVKINRK